MINDEYRAKLGELYATFNEAKKLLDAEFVAGSRFPVGSEIEMEVKHGDEFVPAVGIIRGSKLYDLYHLDTGFWYGVDVKHYIEIVSPEALNNKVPGNPFGIPDGKMEIIFESNLLNGTGKNGTIPKQIPKR